MRAELNTGDLVKCYDTYAEGIVSGAGNGIVLQVHQYSLGHDSPINGESETNINDNAVPWASQSEISSRNYSLNIYSVYRFKEQNIELYEQHNLELISKADNNTRTRT